MYYCTPKPMVLYIYVHTILDFVMSIEIVITLVVILYWVFWGVVLVMADLKLELLH